MMLKIVGAAAALLGLVFSLAAARAQQRDMPDYEQAESIFEATGFQRGMIVHLGCGDGRLTAGFRRMEGHIIHGLDTGLRQQR